MSIAQDAPGAATPQETPTSIARLLAGRQAFAKLTVKSKVKRDIKMDDQTYPMADGPSRVVLLKLPDYQEPYDLTIKSYQYKHAFSTKFGIFVPTIVVLDGDFAVTRDRAGNRAAVEVPKHDEGRPVGGQAPIC
jgi:hypothetical protein